MKIAPSHWRPEAPADKPLEPALACGACRLAARH